MPTKKLSDHIAELQAENAIMQGKINNIEIIIDDMLQMLRIHKTLVKDLIKKVG